MASHRNQRTLTSQQTEALAALPRDLLDDATFPDAGTENAVRLEAFALCLSDVCDALAVTPGEREDILGQDLQDYIDNLTGSTAPDTLAADDDYVTIGRARVPVLGTIGEGGLVALSAFGQAVLHVWSLEN